MAGKSMIERVARAMASADNGAPTTWRLYADDARIAIAAMREPTDHVSRAGEEMIDGHTPGAPVDLLWKSMIDAALSEEQPA
ncbi:hypothetical protein C8J42_101952 [Sphingomonas sp. PP-CE-1A-559]|uniref:hypothetical protein n=1 Tax=Sphingomonas sp. PP-CE-1A-559 TaxID=2135657 RepID=UPI001055011A|nr:hypothetical protein [Sphingomonas sp. PP-CE-1A-559]TCP94486.1 hypothetical protein C8J42_101952 [Sphingomonas sp. PP-CE-1A-559]